MILNSVSGISGDDQTDRADDYDEVDDLSSKMLSTNGVVSLCLIFIHFSWPSCRYTVGV